jgi:hypothetical protein
MPIKYRVVAMVHLDLEAESQEEVIEVAKAVIPDFIGIYSFFKPVAIKTSRLLPFLTSVDDQRRGLFPPPKPMSPNKVRNLPIGALLCRKKPAFCKGYLILMGREGYVMQFLCETLIPGITPWLISPLSMKLTCATNSGM